MNGGRSWSEISPDLTRKTFEVPSNIGKYRDQPTAQASQRGVVYSLGLSPLAINRIWAGTDDGLIQTTADGGLHWKDVTPSELKPFMKVSIIDAGHFDALTAYAAINTLRLDDMHPHILRTHDGGKTWTEIVHGLPDNAPVDVVREDPKRKGLLYAGTERAVFVSFDDGENWQPLRLNMPATSIRDLVVKDDDLVVGTHGRGFWILDDVTPLRQLTEQAASAPAFLFKPENAYRVRWDMNTDTPLPPDEPAGQNPPDGAILDYLIGATSGPVTLEILDSAGKVVRKYASDDPVEPLDPMLAVPTYWARPPLALSAAPGMHRFLWDMHYAPLSRARTNLPMTAIFHDTVPAPSSPWVMPGVYTARLTVDGKPYTQTFTVKMDPRVTTSAAGLAEQFRLAKQCYDDIVSANQAVTEIRTLRANADPAKQAELDKLAGAPTGGRGGGGRGAFAGGPDTLTSVTGSLNQLMASIEKADAAPNAPIAAAVASRHASLQGLLTRWKAMR
jgi:hypothetical protein